MKHNFKQLISTLKLNSDSFSTMHLILISILSISIAITIIINIIFGTGIGNNNFELLIEKGSTLSQISDSLYARGLIQNKKHFKFVTKLKNKQTSLRAGYYNFQDIRTMNQLINLLAKGQNRIIKITIPEGSNLKNIANILAKFTSITTEDFIKTSKDKALLKDLGVNSSSFEGYLFPDTYYFYRNESSERVIRKMNSNFFSHLDDSLRKKISSSGRNLHEILTLASIIEGECMIDSERKIVSSLYHNRLKKNMKLESDPTIQYIIPDGPRRLLNIDLKNESPYNTYMYRGLPPGPINNPGIKSIIAAIYPEKTNYIYMVANGDGSHTFTRTYRSFLIAKSKFQKVRRNNKKQNN